MDLTVNEEGMETLSRTKMFDKEIFYVILLQKESIDFMIIIFQIIISL